jgi:hypothetical protein
MANTDAPPLQGPSELGLSVAVAANPDVLSFDGASQSQILIDARDANGQAAAGKTMRAEIVVNNTLVDFGSLSPRTFVTGSTGRATLTYTAPAPIAGATASSYVDIVVIPSGTDANAATGRSISIRLVPPGVITGGGPNPSFTYSPVLPSAFSDVRFDASATTAAIGAGIANYAWNFGDGSTGGGVTATHQFAAGSFTVTLTATDTYGFSASTSKTVAVGAGVAPIADFTYSPSNPGMNQDILFNASASRAGTGHRIVRYDWNFGSGSPQSGVTVSKAYDTAGTYNVILTVTDEVGQTHIATKTVTISNVGGLTPSFTMSPSNPTYGTLVSFNGTGSTAPTGATIVAYTWDFGDGSAPQSGAVVAYTYPLGPTTSRTYVVRLTITDSTGRTAFSTQNLTVTP